VLAATGILASGSVLDPLYKTVGYLLAVLYTPLHNLGLAIIVMTLIVMAVQLPLIAKQTRSMILMQRVQPEIKKIQQKYKDDRQKQNEELLKFYQENKINPLAGCLPLLIIMPIGIAVFGTFRRGGLPAHVPQTGQFNGLYKALCGPLQPSACNAKIAKSPPAVLHFLGMNLNLSASQLVTREGLVHALPYLGLVGLVVATGWYQVRQTQSRQLRQGSAPPNAQMQAVTKIMPLFFGIFTYAVVAAATLYFVVSNIWRIGQQHFVLNKMYEEEGLMGGRPAGKKPPPEPEGPAPPAKGGGRPSGGKPGSGGGPSGPSSGPPRRKKKRKR